MSTILAILLGITTSGRDEPKGPNDGDKLAGTWWVESMQIQGRERYEPATEMRWTFEGEKLTATGKMIGADQAQSAQGTFRLEPGKEPKSIDIKLGDRAEYKGIYKFDGPHLVICYHPKDRPTAFASDRATKNVLMKFRKR